ncbi:MAG TPA: hypothetical protein PKN48_00135 [Bacteroidales bacterium]|nr:hypothetical protein [Bacteroidales bacterium]
MQTTRLVQGLERGGVYLHLEASELIEALRGKRGDPESEAADVLFVLRSMIADKGISWDAVTNKLEILVDRMLEATNGNSNS